MANSVAAAQAEEMGSTGDSRQEEEVEAESAPVMVEFTEESSILDSQEEWNMETEAVSEGLPLEVENGFRDWMVMTIKGAQEQTGLDMMVLLRVVTKALDEMKAEVEDV